MWGWFVSVASHDNYLTLQKLRTQVKGALQLLMDRYG